MSGARTAVEGALRAAAVVGLAAAAWQRLSPVPPGAVRAEAPADERALPAALARWTATAAPQVRVALDSLPDARTRLWLRALDAAGTRVAWRTSAAPALAAAAEPSREPTGGVQLAVAAPDGAPLAARDALGPLDSVRADGGGARLALPSAGAGLAVRTTGGVARLAPPPRARLGAVVLLARAGWEGKFAAAALEEAGWVVRPRFVVGADVAVAPGGDARALPVLDTARVSAVVALDSSAAPMAAAIAGYVRRGGGLVLAGEAALVPALAALAPASLDAAVREGDATVQALARPRADAVPLAWRPVAGRRALVAAARRVGPGRVVQLAQEETWRRRLAGGDEAPDAHRAFWSRAVAAAAYAPAARDTTAATSPLDPPARAPAPLVATVAALGAPAAAWRDDARPPGAPAPARRVPDAWLVGGALAALLAEVASRRLRGRA